MTTVASFRLKVRRVDHSCVFDLTSPDGQELSATLRYDDTLTELYQNWQQIYSRRYELRSRAKATRKGGSGTPATYDWDHELKLAEAALLNEFDRWLGHATLRAIRERIQQAVHVPSAQSQIGRGNPASQSVEILLECQPIDLARFPWETWKLTTKAAPSDAIRIARTVLAPVKPPAPEPKRQRSKLRLLAIFASAPDLNHEPDLQALQHLSALAELVVIQCQATESAAHLKQTVAAAIADERGWDVLFFAGHSDEAATTGGKLELAPDVALSIAEIEPQLIDAKQRGLQLAIFNSCSGLHIAMTLLQLGVNQAVVMRERIHDAVAHTFLNQFCQRLARYQDVHTALLQACHDLEAEQLAYPSAYLIPSLFRHPDPRATRFQIEPSRWKRLWRQWQPTRREAIAIGIVSLLSVMIPVRELLAEQRYWVQALYRHHTGQIATPTPAPVTLIAIDQDSIDRNGIDIYKVKPLDRTYLAKLVDRLRALNVKVVGIDYFLDGSTTQDSVLAKSLQATVQQQRTWFVFATKPNDAGHLIRVNSRVASSRWVLQGDTRILDWRVMFPSQITCRTNCPFAYQLALAQTLTRSTTAQAPQPSLQSSTDFQNQLSQSLQTIDSLSVPTEPYSGLGVRLNTILDFSLPPQQVYQSIAAWELLERPLDDPQLKALQHQVVIIASGGYDQADDNFPVPLAIQYWREQGDLVTRNGTIASLSANPSQVFTGGEAHAYSVHHLLSRHLIRQVPDFWLVIIAAVAGKGITLLLMRQTQMQRQRFALLCLGATGLSGLVGLQVYLSLLILIPWGLPAILLWSYILPTLKR